MSRAISTLFVFALIVTLWSSAGAQTPTAPSSLTATNGSGNNVNLAWVDNSSTETSFKIERKLGVDGTYSQIDTAAANATTYADTSAKTANRPYIYRVRASNGSGDSAYSNEENATTPFTGTVNNYRSDTANYTETPTTMPLPLAGGKFYDETFGTEIMRFTDDNDGASFSTNYSVWPTANNNNTKLFIYNPVNNSYHIGTMDPVTFTRTGSLLAVASPPALIFSHMESFFWSFLDADKAFVLVDAKIYYYRPSTNSFTLLKNLTSSFPAGYYFIQLYVSNDDDRFAALFRNGSGDQGFMVYDLSEDVIKLQVTTTDMNGITMEKSGQYVYYVADTPLLSKVYTVNTGASETLVSNASTGLPDFQVGHNDTGVDLLFGDDQWQGAINVRQLSTPHTVSIAWQYAPYWISHHVSGRADNEYWGLMSTHGEVGVSADSAKYRRELLQFGLKAPFTGQLRRLAHSRAMWESLPSKSITGATNASPIVITTSTAHGFTTSQRAQISGVGGNTAANGTRTITVLSSTTFSIDGTTGNGAYTSGGTAFVETYWDSPRVTISRDGKFLFWTSNWNGVPGSGHTSLFVAQVEAAPDGSAHARWHRRGKVSARGKAIIR